MLLRDKPLHQQNMTNQEKVSVRVEQSGQDVYHHVERLPKFQQLNVEVKRIVESSTYWERFGFGLVDIGSAIPMHFVSLHALTIIRFALIPL